MHCLQGKGEKTIMGPLNASAVVVCFWYVTDLVL